MKYKVGDRVIHRYNDEGAFSACHFIVIILAPYGTTAASVPFIVVENVNDLSRNYFSEDQLEYDREYYRSKNLNYLLGDDEV